MTHHHYKLIFLHIPKTGGTSIEYAFCGLCLNPYVFNQSYVFGLIDNQYSQHFNHKNIQKYCNTSIENYFIFTFVRNTWDRLVSSYKYLYQKENFDSFIKNKCHALQNGLLNQTDHFQSQMIFIKDDNDKIVPDFIGRFENLQNDFDYVCDANNLIRIKLKHINKSNNSQHYSSYYSPYTRSLVYDTYKEEIDFFDFRY